ncbi:MAG: 5-bromo-4-chloroindolyl phosphate hydrolysis family protein [Thermomicrobiales bacterium]
MSRSPQKTDEALKLAKQRAEELKGFTTHLGVFLIIMIAMFLLNLATSRESWWFFYPFLPWGVGLAIHGWNVLGSDRLFDDKWAERKAQELRTKGQTATSPPASAQPGAAAFTTMPNRDLIQQSAELIDRMRLSARQIPKPEVRRQTLSVCASADQVLSAIEENPREVALASDFLDRYLKPASSIIGDYSRLASRNVASALPTLAKVESHDLPLLTSKLDDLYDRLHRGNLIDLEVAREMLRFDVADWDENGEAIGTPLPADTGSRLRRDS